jgi:CubicO group peptidase (beta-lactamase class C family)
MHSETCHGTSENELVANLSHMPLKFKPGTQFAYSNTNYLVLGAIIQKVSGERWDLFLHERIFAPLGMTHTHRQELAAIVPHRAAGYIWQDDHFENAAPAALTLIDNADAGLVTTVSDLALWEQALESNTLLPPALQDLVFQRTRLSDGSSSIYGFGWFGSADGVMKWHNGYVPGFSSYIARYPAHKLAVIVLTNRDHAMASAIGRHLAVVSDREISHHDTADEDKAVTAIVWNVLEGIQDNTLKNDLFAPEMWAPKQPGGVSDEADVTAALRKLFAGAGKLDDVAFVSMQPVGGKRQYFYTATFGDNDLSVDVTLNQAGKITSMGVDF